MSAHSPARRSGIGGDLWFTWAVTLVALLARLFVAILYEWSEVSGYVRAEVLQPLDVWKGRGKPVEATGKDRRDLQTMTPMQSVNEVYQLFIPGVSSETTLFPSVFKFIEYVPA